MITRLPAAKRALIESVQPFKTAPEHPKTDPLWFLHDLWNLDKHRNLSTVAVGIGSAAIVYRGHKDANITFIERVTEKDLEEGTRVLTFTVTGPKADEMKVEPDISYHVSVEGRPLVDSLKSIRRSVYCFLGEWETGSPVSSTEYVATLLPFGPETT